jgi:hypothetical protein
MAMRLSSWVQSAAANHTDLTHGVLYLDGIAARAFFRHGPSYRPAVGRAYHRSMLARFHQAPAGIGQTDGMAVFNNYPASRDRKLDCVRGLPVDLSRHAPVQRLATCRVVQGAHQVKGKRLCLAGHGNQFRNRGTVK